MAGSTNSFDEQRLRKWFDGNFECWVCGKNHWNCFHHIVGRGVKENDAESSILNAAPVNNKRCHINVHGQLEKEENVKKLLAKTMKYLLDKGYEFNETDKRFISKYKKYYVTE